MFQRANLLIGMFGEVYLCTARNQVPLAVKRISFVQKKKKEIEENVKAEYELLRRLSHPNIVKVYDYQEKINHFLIVMESIGMVMYEMLVGKCMFANLGHGQVVYKVGCFEQQTDLEYDLPDRLCDDVKEILARLLVVDKNSRPTAAQALEFIEQLEKDTIEVFIHMHTGKTLPIETRPSELIESIKMKICDKEGVPPDHQRLIYGGRQLEDFRTLKYYNIEHHSVIYLVLRLRGGSGVKIVVKLLDGKTIITLSADPDKTTIADLKIQIEQRLGIQASRQNLVHIGETLRRLEDNLLVTGIDCLHLYIS